MVEVTSPSRRENIHPGCPGELVYLSSQGIGDLPLHVGDLFHLGVTEAFIYHLSQCRGPLPYQEGDLSQQDVKGSSNTTAANVEGPCPCMWEIPPTWMWGGGSFVHCHSQGSSDLPLQPEDPSNLGVRER